MLLKAVSFTRATASSQPALQETKGVVPESVDLDSLTAARSDHPIIDFGIHPRELVTFLSLDQETVSRIHMNVETSSAEMMTDDVEEVRNELLKQVLIVHVLHVAMNSMEEPEGGIRGVIKPLRFSLGEHIGDEPVAYVVGEGSQDVAGFDRASGGHGEPFKANHSVAAPVRKPVVTSDDAP